jgi:aspartyl-tRNA(Asn)/glutamyl-tRNA(Gln) amidotransferase subunit A
VTWEAEVTIRSDRAETDNAGAAVGTAEGSTGTGEGAARGLPSARTGDPVTPADLSAEELLHAYSTGELSPVEAVESVLDRIEQDNPALNAFCLVRPEEAREAARASAERWRRGEPAGKLDGVPASVKDIHLTKGWPTLKGSVAASQEGPWDEDSPVVARMREHGAVFVGIGMQDNFYTRDVTRIGVGDTVRFSNTGQVPHNAIDVDGAWSTGEASGGEAYST